MVEATFPVEGNPPVNGFGESTWNWTDGGRTVTTARFAVPLRLTATVPRCSPVTGVVTSRKPADVAPSGIVTEAGAVSARFVVEIVTTAPPAGAGADSVTVPVTFCTP